MGLGATGVRAPSSVRGAAERDAGLGAPAILASALAPREPPPGGESMLPRAVQDDVEVDRFAKKIVCMNSDGGRGVNSTAAGN